LATRGTKKDKIAFKKEQSSDDSRCFIEKVPRWRDAGYFLSYKFLFSPNFPACHAIALDDWIFLLNSFLPAGHSLGDGWCYWEMSLRSVVPLVAISPHSDIRYRERSSTPRN
jgi:hypothetical protein